MNTNMRAVVNSNKRVLISSATLLVSLIAIFVGIIPLGRSIVTQYNKNKELQAQIVVLKEKDDILLGLDEQTLSSQLEELTSAIPVDKSVPLLLSALDAGTGQHGVLLSDVSLSAPGLIATESAQPSGDNDNTLTFNIIVEGSPENLRNFISTITTSRRLMRIQKFDIGLTTPELARANISMDALFGPLPKTIGAVATPLVARTIEEEDLLAKITLLPKLAITEASPLPLLIGPLKPDPFSP